MHTAPDFKTKPPETQRENKRSHQEKSRYPAVSRDPALTTDHAEDKKTLPGKSSDALTDLSLSLSERNAVRPAGAGKKGKEQE